jgi:cysteine desulfurase
LKDALRPETTLVSIMHVNNEIGTIMPVAECAAIIRAHSKAYYHTDEVQAIGKVPFDLSVWWMPPVFRHTKSTGSKDQA